MRSVLRKLDQNLPLQEGEYTRLLEYIEQLRQNSPESYLLFCGRYEQPLFEHYSTYLPRFPAGPDQFIEYIIRHPEAVRAAAALPDTLAAFPAALHPYLTHMAQNDLPGLQFLAESAADAPKNTLSLPRPRTQETVLKFEDGNASKEWGLKAHFERLSRFTFVSRLQSYRYLTRRKAARDRIEVVDGQCLGGIFTNKEKSIYYYIFLTENDADKARLACETLNAALYAAGKRG